MDFGKSRNQMQKNRENKIPLKARLKKLTYFNISQFLCYNIVKQKFAYI